MRRRHQLGWLFALVVATVPGRVEASIPGAWALQMTATLAGEGSPCVFQGTAQLSTVVDGQHAFGGPCELELLSGPEGCPGSLSGTLGVDVEIGEGGLAVSGVIDGGEQLGLGSFAGQVVGDPTGSGDFSIESGPFAGLTGTWLGTLGGGVLAIPTLRVTGLLLLAALLAAVSVLALRRRGRAGPPSGGPSSV
jgi:hypothetical protein